MKAKELEQELSIKDGIVSINQTSCDECEDYVDACPQSAISITTLSEDEVKQLPFAGRLKVRIKGKNKASINEKFMYQLWILYEKMPQICYSQNSETKRLATGNQKKGIRYTLMHQ